MERFLIRLVGPSGWLSVLSLAAAMAAMIFYAPLEKIQGPVQKIMYLHVASATISYVAIGVMAIAGGLFLWKGDSRWDRMGRASAELSLLLCAVVMITGPLWARPVWGTFWVWDARLTATLVLFLILLGYFMLRSMVPGERGARFASLTAILAMINVPFIKIATEKFRTMHPSGVVKGGMTMEMGITLTGWMFMLLVVYVHFLGSRLAVAQTEERVRSLEASLEGEP